MRMDQRSSPFVLVSVGIALLGLSFANFLQGGGRSEWTDEKALQYQQAATTFHHLAHEAGHSGGSEDALRQKENLRQAQSDFERLRVELETARHRSIHWPTLLRIAGAALGIAGIVTYFSTRRKAQRELAGLHRVRD